MRRHGKPRPPSTSGHQIPTNLSSISAHVPNVLPDIDAVGVPPHHPLVAHQVHHKENKSQKKIIFNTFDSFDKVFISVVFLTQLAATGCKS